MTKFISLYLQVFLIACLAIVIVPIIQGFLAVLENILPIFFIYAINLFASGIIISVIWLLVIMLVTIGWRYLWKIPLISPWLNNRIFPDLNGVWIAEIQSNFPIIEKMKEASISEKIIFDSFQDSPSVSLNKINFEVEIKQSWFKTNVEFIPNKKTPLLTSKTISVEFLKMENGEKIITWVYEQKNKQDNKNRLQPTDERKFYGAARMIVNENASKIEGEYWQNRSWNRALNAAGIIKLKRKKT